MTSNNFLFAVWPGISVVCFFSGIVARYALSGKQTRAETEKVSRWWKALCRNWLWQLSMGILVVGHVGALLLPDVFLRWNSNPSRLFLLEGCAIALGLAATFSSAIVVWRYLSEAGESVLAEVFDAVFLALICVGLLSGIGLAVIYRWGSSWAAITLTPYIASLFRGSPVTDYVLELPPLVRLHVFCAFGALAIVPLTRLSFLFLYAIDSGLSLVRQVSAAPVTAFTDYVDVVLRNLGSKLWPEED